MRPNGMCRLCGLRKAEVPDRNTTSPRKRICKPCHSKRLMEDWLNVIAVNRAPTPEKPQQESEER